MKKLIVITVILIFYGLMASQIDAHPGSGIVVDKLGNVYFIHTGVGVAKVTKDGKLVYIYKENGGHWMCLDEQGIFSGVQPTFFKRITPDGTKPDIIYAGGGSPIVVNKDRNFYYCGGEHGNLNPGALSLVRESATNNQTLFAPALETTLNKLNDGITGLAAGPDSCLYLACSNSLLKVMMDGQVRVLAHPISVAECDEDPADHKESNRGRPLLRGIDVDSTGTIYMAATSCHCLIKMTPDGRMKTILKDERPWTPTGVAVRNGNIYILEYTNANGPATEGWYPRVRKIDKKGKITIVADLSK